MNIKNKENNFKDWVSCQVIVQGIVQGIGFRFYTQHLAETLDLKGYVCNLPTGDVEIKVEGEKKTIEKLLQHLKTGELANYISGLQIEWGSYRGEFENFFIKF